MLQLLQFVELCRLVKIGFVVVPTLPSPPDIASTDEFFETVVDVARTFKDLDAAILLNQVQRGTRLAAQALDYIRKHQKLGGIQTAHR